MEDSHTDALYAYEVSVLRFLHNMLSRLYEMIVPSASEFPRDVEF